MSDAAATQLTDALHEAAHPLRGTAQDYDPLIDKT
jgi:hypothetical protein